MVGQLNELELAQIENHMSLVHAIAIQLTQAANRAEQIIFIVDLKKIKVKTFSNKMLNTALKKVIALATQYFPDLLYKGFIVNAPMSFSQLWSTFESSIPASTLAKIKVIGGPTNSELTSLVLFQSYQYRSHSQHFRRQWEGHGVPKPSVPKKTSLDLIIKSRKKLRTRLKTLRLNCQSSNK